MLSRTLRAHSTVVLLAFVAAGFAFLLGELLMIGHTFQRQLIGVGAAALGLIVSLIALVPRPGLRRIVLGLYVVLALVGLFGFFIHLGGRARRQTQVATVPPPEDRILRRALSTFARNPPLVPPLALSGLATLGIVTLLSANVAVADPRVQPHGLAPVPE